MPQNIPWMTQTILVNFSIILYIVNPWFFYSSHQTVQNLALLAMQPNCLVELLESSLKLDSMTRKRWHH